MEQLFGFVVVLISLVRLKSIDRHSLKISRESRVGLAPHAVACVRELAPRRPCSQALVLARNELLGSARRASGCSELHAVREMERHELPSATMFDGASHPKLCPERLSPPSRHLTNHMIRRRAARGSGLTGLKASQKRQEGSAVQHSAGVDGQGSIVSFVSIVCAWRE